MFVTFYWPLPLKQVYRRRYASRRSSFKKNKNKIKYGEKRFSIWRMEFLYPAMWHVALESWQWIHQVAAPCNVTRSSGIMTLNSPGDRNVAGGSGMTCNWIRPNVRHISIHLLSISTISPQSACHSAPVCEILSKSDHPRQKKMTSCRFSRWRISAIFDIRGPIMGSLKSSCTTSYRSSIETIALNCLVFEKIAFFYFGDRQTNKQMDSTNALSRCRCHERRLNNNSLFFYSACCFKHRPTTHRCCKL